MYSLESGQVFWLMDRILNIYIHIYGQNTQNNKITPKKCSSREVITCNQVLIYSLVECMKLAK